MLNKRHLHHQYTRIRPISAWPFLAASLLLLAIGIYGLRQNNLEMVRLREAVFKADETGGNVEKALAELREHVHGHMNTDLSGGQFSIDDKPIQLKHRYDKLADREEKRVEKLNQGIKADAERVCAARHPGGGFNSPRVACVAEYLRQNGVEPKPVPSELYKFDFVSPRWSPDLAGWSLLASAVLFIVFLLRAIAGWWYKRLL